jgi:D-psicose/D-tagatose/L-ribulose 3-epimerase
MRISISNIAWDPEDDEAMATLLPSLGVTAIDIAPGKYFKNFREVKSSEILKVKSWWQTRGVEIVGMQALLFGTQGLNLFSCTAESMREHLQDVMRIGSELGAKKLVFGSPKNRDRSGLTDAETQQKADAFFSKLGDFAKSLGVVLCLETNPVDYQCNFMTSLEETAGVVNRLNHPNIRLQLDTGAMLMNGEPASLIQKYAPLTGHIHLSEPHLKPLGAVNSDHSKLAEQFSVFPKSEVATIEMVKPVETPQPLRDIEKSLRWALENYGHRGH